MKYDIILMSVINNGHSFCLSLRHNIDEDLAETVLRLKETSKNGIN